MMTKGRMGELMEQIAANVLGRAPSNFTRSIAVEALATPLEDNHPTLKAKRRRKYSTLAIRIRTTRKFWRSLITLRTQAL
jgi:hypothetical protein